MKTLQFLLTLFTAGLLHAAGPQPPILRNPFTTNEPPASLNVVTQIVNSIAGSNSILGYVPTNIFQTYTNAVGVVSAGKVAVSGGGGTNNIFTNLTVRAMAGTTNDPFIVRGDYATLPFKVASGGGFGGISEDGTAGPSAVDLSLGGLVNGYIGNSTNSLFVSSSGGSAGGYINNSPNTSILGSSGGEARLYLTSSPFGTASSTFGAYINGRVVLSSNVTISAINGSRVSGHVNSGSYGTLLDASSAAINHYSAGSPYGYVGSASGASVSSYFNTSFSNTVDGRDGSSLIYYGLRSTNALVRSRQGGAVNAYSERGNDFSIFATNGGRVSLYGSNAASSIVAASDGGAVYAYPKDASAVNLSAKSSIAVANYETSQSVTGLTTSGSAAAMLMRRSTNVTFTADSGSSLWLYSHDTVGAEAHAINGASLFGVVHHADNSLLHSAHGSFMAGIWKDNTSLMATNGGIILGAPPAGTTNTANGRGLFYGALQIFGPLTDTNGNPYSTNLTGEVSTAQLNTASNWLWQYKLDSTNGSAWGTLTTSFLNTEGELHTYDGIFVDTTSGFIDPLKFLYVPTAGDSMIISGSYGPADIATNAVMIRNLTNVGSGLAWNGSQLSATGGGGSTNNAGFSQVDTSVFTTNANTLSMAAGYSNGVVTAITNGQSVIAVPRLITSTAISANGTLGVVGAATFDGTATFNASVTHNSRMTNNGTSVFNDTATFNSNVVFNGQSFSVSGNLYAGGLVVTNISTNFPAGVSHNFPDGNVVPRWFQTNAMTQNTAFYFTNYSPAVLTNNTRFTLILQGAAAGGTDYYATNFPEPGGLIRTNESSALMTQAVLSTPAGQMSIWDVIVVNEKGTNVLHITRVNPPAVAASGGGGTMTNDYFMVRGVGTGYSLTTSDAEVTYGTTSITNGISSGTWLITVEMRFTGDAGGTGDLIVWQLYDKTSSASLTGELLWNQSTASQFNSLKIVKMVTTTNPMHLVVLARNNNSARSVVGGNNSWMEGIKVR